MAMSIFETKAQKDARILDSRAAALISRMNECRANLPSLAKASDAEIKRRSYRLADKLLGFAHQKLTGSADDYRKGGEIHTVFAAVDIALQLVDGLRGRANRTGFEKMGARMQLLEARLLNFQRVEDCQTAPDVAGIQLAGQLVDSAAEHLGNYVEELRFGLDHALPWFTQAERLLDRADEALLPNSAGVSFVARLEALTTRALRLVKAA